MCSTKHGLAVPGFQSHAGGGGVLNRGQLFWCAASSLSMASAMIAPLAPMVTCSEYDCHKVNGLEHREQNRHKFILTLASNYCLKDIQHRHISMWRGH